FLANRLEDEIWGVWNSRWDGLRIDKLRELPEHELRLLLRRWLQAHHIPIPALSRIQMECLARVIQREPNTRHASFTLDDWVIMLHAGHLFLVKPLPQATISSTSVIWDPSTRQWKLWPGWGVLRLAKGSPTTVLGLNANAWHITLRSGGEKMVWHRNAGHSALKEIFRSESVPPWIRSRVPLLFAGTELVAAGDWFWNPYLFEGNVKSGEKPLVWEPDQVNLMNEKKRYDYFLNNSDES
ncbi:MAG: tRNA lysidine(34) synthetase TilS, partial [Gammaproteobacteria bacterium]